MNEKRYLGDGVYVAVANGMLCLTAEDGLSISNQIFLEPEVMDALIKFYEEKNGAK